MSAAIDTRLLARRHAFGWPLWAALASGWMLRDTLGLHPNAALAWLAPLPLLIAAYRSAPRTAGWLAFLAGGIGASVNFDYYALTSRGIWIPILIVLLQSLGWAAVVRRASRAVQTLQHWSAPLVYPMLCAGLDVMVTALSPHGSWGSLAVTQLALPPVLQIAALLGAPAIVFVISVPASIVAFALTRRRGDPRARASYAVPTLAVVAALGYGAARLANAVPAPNAALIGLTAIDVDPPLPRSAAERDALLARYEANTSALAAQGARLIVWPEKIARVDDADAVAVQARLGALAQRLGIELVASFAVGTPPARHNVAWLFDPNGRLIADYAKQHPVPQLEADIVAGDRDVVANTVAGRTGLAVCADLMYPALGRRYGRAGIDAVIAPAWDFDRDGALAGAIAALRGVESGYAVIRNAREGRLQIRDRYGRIVVDSPSRTGTGSAALARLPTAAGATLYAWTGDIFGWLCALGFWLLGIAGRPMPRR